MYRHRRNGALSRLTDRWKASGGSRSNQTFALPQQNGLNWRNSGWNSAARSNGSYARFANQKLPENCLPNSRRSTSIDFPPPPTAPRPQSLSAVAAPRSRDR